MTEQELATKVVDIVRRWGHGESECVTASERALCHVTMHQLINMVFDFDEGRTVATPAPPDDTKENARA